MAEGDEPYWDEWGQYIDGYGVYDEHGNYVYPDTAEGGGDGGDGGGDGWGQPQSPGVGVDPSWYASGEPFGDEEGGAGGAEVGASDGLDAWEQMYDDDGHAYYFNHHTSDWQYEEPAGFARHRVDAAPGEQGYWDEHGEYHWHDVAADGAAPAEHNAAADATANPPADFTDSQGWQAVDDGYGNLYYYNHYSGDSAWEAPESYSSELAAQSGGLVLAEAAGDAVAVHNMQPTDTDDAADTESMTADQKIATISGPLDDDKVSFKGTTQEKRAATRIQTVHRGRQARRVVARKRQLQSELSSMHRSAVKDNVANQTVENAESETRAATRVQSVARRRNARHRLANMKMLAPLLSRLQDCIDEQRPLFGSPIDSPEDLFQKIDKEGTGAVTLEQIFDALSHLNVGVEAPGQRKRLMEVVDVDNSGSVDLREFKRGLRIGNQQFHRSVQKQNHANTSKVQSDLTETEKRMREVRDRLHKKKAKDIDKAPTTPGTMSISREDFLKQHSQSMADRNGDNSSPLQTSPTGVNKDMTTPRAKSSTATTDAVISIKLDDLPNSLEMASPMLKEKVAENTGSRHLVSPKVSRERMQDLRAKAEKMEKALLSNSEDKVACAKYGYILLEQGKYEESLTKLEKAAQLGVDTPRLWRSLGHVFFLTDRVDSSRSMYSKAERRHMSAEEKREKKCKATGEKFEPRKIPLLMLYRWARTDIRRRNFKDAANRLGIIVQQSPGLFDTFVQQQEVYVSLASCKFQLGDYEEALDWFQTCVMSRPGGNRNGGNKSRKISSNAKANKGNNRSTADRRRRNAVAAAQGSDKKAKGGSKSGDDLVAWRVGHLMKRAVQYLMARCYQGMGEPERARIMLARAARRIPRRPVQQEGRGGGSDVKTEVKGQQTNRTNKGSKKVIKTGKKKGNASPQKKPQDKAAPSSSKETNVDYISDDSGTSADDFSGGDDEDLGAGAVDATNSADGTSNLLDPGLALNTKKGDLVAKFGAFWANRRHYELGIDMLRTALAADEHRQDWWTLLATCLKRQGRTADAVEAAERAHNLSSASGQGWRTRASPFDDANIDSKMKSWQKDRELYGDNIPSRPPSAGSLSNRRASRPSTAGSTRKSGGSAAVSAGVSSLRAPTADEVRAAREDSLKMEQRIIDEISRRMNETLSEKLDALTAAITPARKRKSRTRRGSEDSDGYAKDLESGASEGDSAEESSGTDRGSSAQGRRKSRQNQNRRRHAEQKARPSTAAAGLLSDGNETPGSGGASPTRGARPQTTQAVVGKGGGNLSSMSLLSNQNREAWAPGGKDDDDSGDVAALAADAAYTTAAAAASISSSSNAWASRSQTRLARVAQLAARATSALAEALRQASPTRPSAGSLVDNGSSRGNETMAEDDSLMPTFTPSHSMVLEEGSSQPEKQQHEDSMSPETKTDLAPVSLPKVGLGGIRDGTALREDQKPAWREGRDLVLIRRVFEEISDTGNFKTGAVPKKAFLDALAQDFAVQEFVMAHPYNLIQPLLLRSQTFTPREGATVFEQASSIDLTTRNIRWPDIEEQMRSLGGSTNAIGAGGHEMHDQYDPRFAYDGQRQRSQAEREERDAMLRKKAELKKLQARQAEIERRNREQDERIRQMGMSSLDTLGGTPGADGVSIMASTTDPRLQSSLMSQSSSLAYQDDHVVPVSAGGTLAQDSMFHNSVLPGDLDHELSWQYKGGDGRPPRRGETEEERRLRLEREEADFRRKRAAVEAELSVARTALAVRNLEAAQHIETVGRELKKRLEGTGGRSRTHELLNIRADAAAEISRMSADAESVRKRVQEHINKVDDMLDLRRDSKANRRHTEARTIASVTLKKQKARRKRLTAGNGEDGAFSSSSGEEQDDNFDDEDGSEALPGDGIIRLASRGGRAGSAAVFKGRNSDKKTKKKKKRTRGRSRRGNQKIFVDSSDPEMRMLFADYEHGSNVRRKILQVRTVHKHISEEEAFLALVECNSDVDKAIGRLTDARFFRDLRTVSQLAKHAKPGEVAHATATAMQKGSEKRKQTNAVLEVRDSSSVSQGASAKAGGRGGGGGETESFAPTGRGALENTYDQWLKYRNEREATDETMVVRRVGFHSSNSSSALNSSGSEILEKIKGGGGVPNGMPPTNVSLTPSASNLASTLAQSPYTPQPFRKKKPTKAQRKRFRKKSGQMADSFPAYIDGALKAETNWKKRGGMRRRMHGGGAAMGGGMKKKRKLEAHGSGARAAAALKRGKRPRVSQVGAFEGVNPTIDNPTPEYRAVQFAMREVLPIPAKALAYKSDYRQIPKNGEVVNPEDLEQLANLA